MSQFAATEEALGRLHQTVAQTLIAQLEGEPIFDDEGEEIGRKLDPRVLTAAITFLNNNKIKANPFISAEVSEIEKKLAEKTKRFNKVKQSAKEAAKKYAESV